MPTTKRFVVVPRDGHGLITSKPAYLLDDKVDSYQQLLHVIQAEGSWASRTQDTAATDGSTTVSGPIWSMNVLNAKDPSAPAGSPVVVGPFFLASGNTDGTGTSQLWRSDNSQHLNMGGVFANCTDPHEAYFLNVKNRCFWTGSVMTTNPGISQKYPTNASYRWGIDGPTNSMVYDAYNAATNAVTKQVFYAAGATVVNGNVTVNAAGPAIGLFPADPAWVGKTIVINGNEVYTIRTVTGISTLDMTTKYTGTGATYDMLTRYGNLSWSGNSVPKYAYAYYDPVSAHISNINPVLTFSEHDISNVGMNIQGIQKTLDPRFTEIILFRNTLAEGGAILMPLKLDSAHGGTAVILADGNIDNSGVAGSVSYRDYGDDNQVGLGVGGRLEGPTANFPPPTDAKYTAYWDGRIWTISAKTPYRIVYSNSSVQTNFGVREECYDPANFIDLSSDDGTITGIRTVGDQIIVSTERFMYTVNGTSEVNYRFVKIGSRGSAIDHWAMAEHPGDTSNASASIIYLSRDARLWRQYPNGQIIDIGEEIQDKLDLLDLSKRRPGIVNVFQLGKNWMCVVGIRNANTRYDLYFLDLDKHTWLDWGYAGTGTAWSFWAGAVQSGNFFPTGKAFIGLTTVSGTTLYYNKLGDTSGYNGGQTMTTHQLDFGERTAKKTLQGVNIYVSDNVEVWGVSAQFDGAGGYTALNRITVASTPRAAGPNIQRFDMSSIGPKQFHCIELKFTFPSSFSGRPKIHKYEIVYGVSSTDEAGVGN